LARLHEQQEGIEDPVRCVVQSHGTTNVVAVAGELDLASVGRFRSSIEAAFTDAAELVVADLSEVTFMDSSGVHALVGARSRAAAHGVRFVVVPADEIWHLFRTAGIADVLDGSVVAPGPLR
jgi:anti-sigma B factor antagonist